MCPLLSMKTSSPFVQCTAILCAVTNGVEEANPLSALWGVELVNRRGAKPGQPQVKQVGRFR